MSIRLRRDINDWLVMNCININGFINDMLLIHVKACQRGQQNYQKWIRKNR